MSKEFVKDTGADKPGNGFLSDVEIKNLKKKHNLHKVYQLSVETEKDSGDSLYAYLKKPGVKILEATAQLWRTHPFKASFTIVNTCWLDGDKRIKNAYDNDDIEIVMTVSDQIQEIVEQRAGGLKKR